MSKEIYISSTPHETRLAIVEDENLAEIYYERENEYTLAGSIYNGRVTRVLPGMQSSFVDIGLERDAFLYITDFMEEAGDSADFEQNANGGDHARAPKRENQRDREQRGGRRERSPRGEGESSRTGEDRSLETRSPEMTDAEMFRAAVDGDQPRNDRGRGGRDRNERRDRSQSVSSQSVPGQPRPEVSRLDTPPAPEGSPAGESLGEGAPGADGSRRWRGRRGRRGNRGGERREQGADSQRQPAGALDLPSDLPRDTPSARPETGSIADAYADDGAGEFDPTATASYGFGEQSGADFEFDAAAESTHHAPRREAGRGGRDRNRGGRGSRFGNEPAAPGYEDSYGAAYDSTPAAAADMIEPLILPGESLSKYRQGALEGDAEAAGAAPPPAPAPEFSLREPWDGGPVLPGETLRRREPQGGHAAPSADRPYRGPRGDRDNRKDGRERGRFGRPDRFDRSDRPAGRFVPAEPAATAQDTPPQAAPVYASMPAAEIDSRPSALDSTFVPPPPMPESEREYEPTAAAVSYRVDPAPPSEYRQSAPTLDSPLDADPGHVESLAPPAELAPAPLHEAFTETEPAVAVSGETVADSPGEHQVTSISAMGDMRVEPTVECEAAPHTAEIHAAAVPASHEGALSFAPGTGLLEEEVLEDEELDGESEAPLAALHAGADHEQEHTETLEGAADLGSMLREMSIDQITRSEPASDLDEDDDLEEDFLEEDFEDNGDFDNEEGEETEESPEADSGEMEAAEPRPFFEESTAGGEAVSENDSQQPRRDGRREDRGRRDGRRGDRGRRPASGERVAEPERAPERGGRRDGRGGRQSMQTTNLPAISDLLKPGQEILVQIAKEPIAKKGARITSHIALPGRFLVFMPTVSHTGISRKIESDGERRRLKEILLSEKGEATGGFIVRTAAAGASEEELRSDLRFLLNLWTDIKARSESSKSPALIYHDLNLVERVLRDQVTDTFSAIWVDTESQYEQVLRFLQRFQPSLIRRVKLYTKETPLFEQFGITDEINKALRSKVWLKSGGSIVINQTEALVAIDINTGKYVGKTARLEDTIVKTNLDAIPEIVRQIRLRDLGGIIIIDFIDMDERKNRNRVMAALEEELKSDRAPSKVLQFNDFGLVAITRKRVKQSLERTLSTTCGVCAGTGMVKSPVTVANDIYVEMRKMHKHLDRGDVMLRVHPEVVKQLKSTSARWLQEMEEMVGKTILVKSDPSLHPEQFDIH